MENKELNSLTLLEDRYNKIFTKEELENNLDIWFYKKLNLLVDYGIIKVG